ncbi:anthranilate synthase component I [Halorussus sp. MSC15.2]|uniref:anthranilate synthase component I n=1 Tax=Halorussus sp. MSC15.2 TaxID=2283638 RepID=UPI0013D806C0|nr:anthranilate synthase component I [Halorussus sp. MSC15.2]NEU55968.1 anthranilate synthase component I [Halorussus sp. MSC15.2]
MRPERAQFTDLAGHDDPAVIRVEAQLDVATTPLSAYAALTGRSTATDPSEYAFLLESAEKTASSDPDGAFSPDASGDRHARYSYVGYDPEAVVTVDPEDVRVESLGGRAARYVSADHEGDALDALRSAMPDAVQRGFPDEDRQHFEGGLVGFLAYDAVYDLWLDEVGVERPDSRFPDAQFVLNTKTVAFDHREGTVSLVFTPLVGPEDDPGAVYDELRAEADRVADLLESADAPETGGFVRESATAGPRDEYEQAVRTAKEHVLDGDIYQGVISRKRELRGDVDPLGFYEALRDVNPSPYMYLLGYDDLTVVGASPETLVSVRGREVMANPIAGTCSRGSSPVEDRRLAGEMLADGKERAEHTMLVDLARNDVRRVSEPGSVQVEEFMNVLKYSHVQHIESTVTGRLAEDSDPFDATRASFPAGTLSGAPKIRAMEIIDDLELSARGLYGGGVGYYSWSGDADFAIVIRTATVESRATVGDPGSDRITVQAGAGIVADSDPAAEYEETEQKMDGVLTALERIEESDAADAADAPEVGR